MSQHTFLHILLLSPPQYGQCLSTDLFGHGYKKIGQCFSTHLLNIPCNTPLNTSSQPTLSIHPIDPPYQPSHNTLDVTLITSPINRSHVFKQRFLCMYRQSHRHEFIFTRLSRKNTFSKRKRNIRIGEKGVLLALSWLCTRWYKCLQRNETLQRKDYAEERESLGVGYSRWIRFQCLFLHIVTRYSLYNSYRHTHIHKTYIIHT